MVKNYILYIKLLPKKGRLQMKRIGFVAVVLLLTVAPLLTSCKKKEEAPAPAEAPTAPAAPMTTTTGAPAAAPAAPAAPAAH